MMKSLGRSPTIAATFRERLLPALKPYWNAKTKLALKVVLGVLVLGTVGRHVAQTWSRLHEQGRSLRVGPGWIGLSMVLYLAGLSLCGEFFRRILRASPTPLHRIPAIRSYLISHLGKYVPGKALVVVMRVGMVRPHGVRASTAAFATLYETLVMMAAGSLVATLGFILDPVLLWPVLAGLALATALLPVAHPKVFPRIAALLSRPLKGVGPEALPTFSGGLLVEGLLWSSGGWLLLGLSQVAVIRAVSPGVDVGTWPLVVGSVALATVSGFVIAILPGGLGVREGVLMATLAPALDPETAVVAALTLRLAWVLAELAAAGALSIVRHRPGKAPVP